MLLGACFSPPGGSRAARGPFPCRRCLLGLRPARHCRHTPRRRRAAGSRRVNAPGRCGGRPSRARGSRARFLHATRERPAWRTGGPGSAAPCRSRQIATLRTRHARSRAAGSDAVAWGWERSCAPRVFTAFSPRAWSACPDLPPALSWYSARESAWGALSGAALGPRQAGGLSPARFARCFRGIKPRPSERRG